MTLITCHVYQGQVRAPSQDDAVNILHARYPDGVLILRPSMEAGVYTYTVTVNGPPPDGTLRPNMVASSKQDAG